MASLISRDDLQGLYDLANAATQEPWAIGHSGTQTHEEAIAYITDALTKSDRTDLWMVFIGNPEIEGDTRVVAYTGNGPTSEANARYLANLSPENLRTLVVQIWQYENEIRRLTRLLEREQA
jgi:hypothetical protein